MGTTPTEKSAAGVSPATGTTRATDVRARWAWAEPTVWNARMLTALENGVKGGKWISLIDKVYSMPNLRAAFAKVKANAGAAGVDRQTVEMFENHLEANLAKLSQQVREGSYRAQAVRRQWIPKPGKPGEHRPLGIPTVRDRVVQAAVRNVLEPIFERDFAAHSYGFRAQRGCKEALRRVNELLERGYTWVVDADLKSYFDTIAHRRWMEQVRQKVSDGRVLELLQAYLQQPILDGLKQWTPEGGTPQGAVLSPLLSNIYLDPLDHQMAEAGYEMVLESWVRMCLRSILRKRQGRRGRGRGNDHQRWPNAYFTQQGLYSLTAARAQRVSVLSQVNHRPESRMREIRTYGSEGGGA